MQSLYLQRIMKKNAAKGYEKQSQNKPNFRNGQNERKLNFNTGLQKKQCFRSPKNKPIQSLP